MRDDISKSLNNALTLKQKKLITHDFYSIIVKFKNRLYDSSRKTQIILIVQQQPIFVGISLLIMIFIVFVFVKVRCVATSYMIFYYLKPTLDLKRFT